jgi:hypothetical protein
MYEQKIAAAELGAHRPHLGRLLAASLCPPGDNVILLSMIALGEQTNRTLAKCQRPCAQRFDRVELLLNAERTTAGRVDGNGGSGGLTQLFACRVRRLARRCGIRRRTRRLI